MGCNCGNNKKISNLAKKIKKMAKKKYTYKYVDGINRTTSTIRWQGVIYYTKDMTMDNMEALYNAGCSAVEIDETSKETDAKKKSDK